MARRNFETDTEEFRLPSGTNEPDTSINSGDTGTAGDNANESAKAGNPVDPESAANPDPATASNRNSRNSARANSGNRKDSRKGKRAAQRETEKENLTALLYSIHFMMAEHVAPELALEQEQSEMLADAIQKVEEQFSGYVVSPKIAALTNLAVVAGGIYLPAFMLIRARKMSEPKTITVEQDIK